MTDRAPAPVLVRKVSVDAETPAPAVVRLETGRACRPSSGMARAIRSVYAEAKNAQVCLSMKALVIRFKASPKQMFMHVYSSKQLFSLLFASAITPRCF